MFFRSLLRQKSKFSSTIFDKILAKLVPSSKVYEDDLIYAFNDISPQAPVHVLIIPKVKDGLNGISKMDERHKELIGHIFLKAKEIAELKGVGQTGYRLIINQGKHGQQTVEHLHVHLLGGKQLKWPPG